MSATRKIKSMAIDEDILVKRDEADPIFKVLDDGVADTIHDPLSS